MINVEFDWGTDIYVDRQIVAEKMALAADRLPEGVKPQLAPISSIMGQIMMIGMYSEGGKTDPIEVRTLADWVVRQRLLTIPGVAQVITMGGGRKQFQVLVDPDALLKYGVTLEDVEQAVADSNANATGGYLERRRQRVAGALAGPAARRSTSLRTGRRQAGAERPVLLSQVARVVEGGRRSSGATRRSTASPAVMLTISKQPGADTRLLTEQIIEALDELQAVAAGRHPHQPRTSISRRRSST